MEAPVRADTAPRGERPRGGLRRNFAWALTGNGIYQASQWLSLVVLAKLTSPSEVGRFALALAICTPITRFSSLNLRAVQVTDARDDHRFGHFVAVQVLASAVALLLIVAIAAASGYDARVGAIIVLVGLGQAVFALRDVFLSYNQKHERMDTVAVSKTIVGVTSLASLTLVLWWTRELLWAVAALQAAKVICFLTWDLRATFSLMRRHLGDAARGLMRPEWHLPTLWGLAWLALPLGVTSLLITLIKNVPRYYIEIFLDAEMLGYFAAIAALVVAGDMVIQAAGMSVLPRLSRYYVASRRHYIRLLLMLVGFGGLVGLAGVGVALAVGGPLLAVIFTPDYADYNTLFVWMMGYGMVTFMVSFLGYGLTATRRFKVQPPIFFAALATTALTGWLLVPAYGLTGGVWCMIAGRLVQGAGVSLVLARTLQLSPSTTTEPRRPEAG